MPGIQGIETLKQLKGLLVLTRALGRMEFISMMHHMDKIDNAVPATVDGTSLLETTEENVPKINFLLALKDKDKVFQQMESTTATIKTKICNSIVMPPWLAKVLITNKASTMGNTFMIALRAAVSRDAVKVQELGMTSTGIGRNVKDIAPLLLHLYCWSQDVKLWSSTGEVVSNATNAANAAFDEDVLEWSEELHSRFLSK
eukprot:4249387-Ditylum_brightwellii.AAC.1